MGLVRLTRSLAGSPALVHLTMMSPGDVMGAFGSSPMLIATFFGVSGGGELDPYVVGMAFELTPAEARVAVAIAQGEPVQRVAERLRVGVATIRTHLRCVFDKTGARRQADLAQLLSRNPVFWRL